MPRGHASASINVAGVIVTCDYTWHSYTESNGPRNATQSFLDWSPVAFYINDTQATQSEIKRLAPNYDTLLDNIIQERH